MKVFNTSCFKIYERDFEGNWDYLISETPLIFGAIEGVLQLNYSERMAIVEILEKSDGIKAITLGDKTYGFEYTGEMIADHKYRLINAKFENISSVIVSDHQKTEKKVNRRLK